MTDPAEQVFPGRTHALRFVFRRATDAPDRLLVVFSDATADPGLDWLDELEVIGCHQLFVADDFGPHVDGHGYPGCWYLGEAGDLSYSADVERLVAHAAAASGVAPPGIVGCGMGKGGFASLWFATRGGWGASVCGWPHVRLGRQLAGALREVLDFVSGGSGRPERDEADRLLLDALASAESVPAVDVFVGRGDPEFARHVLPLAEALHARGTEPRLAVRTPAPTPEGRAAQFGSHLVASLADLLGVAKHWRPTSADHARATPFSHRVAPRVTLEDDGVRCFAPAAPADDEAGLYAGVRAPAEPFSSVVVDLTARRPDELLALTVDAAGADGERLGRWQWPIDQTWAPASERTTIALQPGRSSGPFSWRDGDGSSLDGVTDLDVFVRTKPGATVDLTLHEIALAPPQPARTTGLKLPRPDAAERERRARMGVLADVRELVATGRFPPAFTPPEGPVVRPDLKVACLLDRFSELGFRYEFDYVDFTPDDFREVIDREHPSLLLVESIWRGKDDTWDKLMADTTGTGPSEPVRELVAHCRKRGIPTVFWSKEDPPNFQFFLSTAVLFDHIFTTDEACVPSYRAAAGHDRVGVIPFAAQPRIHNPIDAPAVRPYELGFLGTYHGRKHPDRRRQMEEVLDAARRFGVHVYSRVEPVGEYALPAKYLPHLVGGVSYERVLGAYRNYQVLLNVNSVAGSPTMCARRIFEILACGGVVLSGESPAIEAVIGPNLVFESARPKVTREVLAGLLGDETLRAQRSTAGRRAVLRSHTYGHRVDEILEMTGLGPPRGPAGVAVIAEAPDRRALDRMLEMLRRQEHPNLELVAVTDELDETTVRESAGRARFSGAAVADDLRSAAARAGGDAVLFLGAGQEIDRHLVTDLVQAQAYSGAGVVGLPATARSAAGAYAKRVDPGAVLVRRDVLDRAGPPENLERRTVKAWQAGLGGVTAFTVEPAREIEEAW
ncbi:MAG TPA: glycosyltransferase [Thermoleophilaceae bacterium]|nr:glycosyltransferase [Thermoleophilaceae bacterium]